MIRFLRRVALFASLAVTAGSAHARVIEDDQLWLNLTALGSIKGKLVYLAELQPRFRDGLSATDQAIMRGALGWKLSPKVTLYQGYAHIVVPIENAKDRNEERSFQQISWNIAKLAGGPLSSRTRLEQRWRSDGQDVGWRFREMLRYARAFNDEGKGSKGLVYSEAFIAFNDTDWGVRSGFDQVRTFLGLEIPVGGASTIEAGYLNQYINRAGRDDRMNHVASLTLFIRR